MKRPLLQFALDNLTLEEAIEALKTGIDEVVDIIECGTLLIGSEGRKVIGLMRRLYPEKTLCADFKIADAGKAMGGMILDGKPDLMTVIAAAHPSTIKAVKDEIDRRGMDTEIQIELFGNWTFEDVKTWKSLGISHVILHHSRDIKGGWSKEELALAKRLCEEGMNVSVTGSIGYEDIDLFRGLPVYSIICGRSLRDTVDPKAEALRMKEKLTKLWECEND
ncbi:MAG: orotidine 5'-phosphate decarboxylase [Erysipelotrichaceae bacterium]|nr:orotidine 5'-phosphate decarboxylase [Erysipelotrichaceae bacterium]